MIFSNILRHLTLTLPTPPLALSSSFSVAQVLNVDISARHPRSSLASCHLPPPSSRPAPFFHARHQWRIQDSWTGGLTSFFLLQPPPLLLSSLLLLLIPLLFFLVVQARRGAGAPPAPTLDPPLGRLYIQSVTGQV